MKFGLANSVPYGDSIQFGNFGNSVWQLGSAGSLFGRQS
jgi:hypothetical protein